MVKQKKLRKKRPISAKLNALWTEFKRTGDHDLREQLIERYIPCARAMAERTKAKLPENVDINDLYSAGLLGLMDAVNTFEPERGIRFETYCSLRIRGAILDDLRASDWVPRLVRSKAQKLSRAVASLRVELDREPLDDEIAASMQMPLGEFVALKREVGEISVQISLENRWNESGDDDPRRRGRVLTRCYQSQVGRWGAQFMAQALGVEVPPLGESVGVSVSTGVLFRVISISSLDLRKASTHPILERMLEEAEFQRGGAGGATA